MINSFSRSATTGWTVVIGVPKAILMAEIRQWVGWTLAGTVLLSLTGIPLALPIGRSVEQIERGLRRASAVVESSDDAIISTSLDGVITTWNKGAEQIYGYTAAEAIGQSINFLAPPECQQELPNMLQRIWRGERVEHYESVCARKDGRQIDVSITISPLKNDREEITGASTIARDITERKQAEKRVTHLASFPEINPSPVFETDLEGKIIYANPSTRRSFPNLIQLGQTHGLLKEWPALVELFKTGRERQIAREVEVDGSVFLQEFYLTPSERFASIW